MRIVAEVTWPVGVKALQQSTKVWRHKNEISEIMIFVRIFWKNNVPEAYLPKMSISGQIVPEIVAQLCLENPIQTLLIFFWVDPPQKITLWVQCKPGGRKFSIIVMLSTKKKKQNTTTGHQHNNNNNNNNNHRQDWSHREMNLQPLPWKRLDLRVARMTT